jgi:heme/copper-type cytochrome/quinol oxidase subunit 2
MRASARVAAVILLVVLILPAVLSACPLCKEATPDGEYPGGSASLGRGFYYSILLMIAVPWTAVGTVAFLIFRRRRRDKLAADGHGMPFLPESRGVEP